jgi:hypothetical protein
MKYLFVSRRLKDRGAEEERHRCNVPWRRKHWYHRRGSQRV